VDCPENLRARLHGTLFERAVENLLDNAIHYSEPGRTVRVEAFEEEGSGDVVVRVRDEGFGIPAEHLSRIFERFFRIAKYRNRKPDGTGLGLAIVKYIVQAHRGSVGAESEPGKGSVFTIRLPGGSRAQDAGRKLRASGNLTGS
jgi:two-component system phosphate regulon sensor histidine kinase PhoR